MSDDSTLNPFVDALRAEIDAELTAEPDLVAVVAEAKRRDPSAVSSALVEEIGGLAEVVKLHRPRRAVGPAIRPFVEAMRDELDASLGERGLAEIPPLRRITGRPRRSRALAWGLSVAAALALLFSAARPLLISGAPGAGPVEAQRIYDGGASGRAIAPTGPRLNTNTSLSTGRIVEVKKRGMSDKPDTTAKIEDTKSPGTEADESLSTANPDASKDPTSEGSTRPGSAAKAPHHVAPENELAALDRRAQAAWRRGDLAQAERLLIELTERGGTTGRAELAFGDLFTLAHQRGRPAAQGRYWRAYLRVFPRGRFVDDARAGLCRQREGAEAAACWRRYLVRQPQGSHRREALEALGRSAEEGRR